MDVIVTHTNADFDGLASMIAVRHLYPGAKLVIPGSAERNVRDFITAYKDLLPLEKEKKIKRNQIERLILVDTRLATRIGGFRGLVVKGLVEVHIYDHHPAHPDDIQGNREFIHRRGATVTIILSQLKQRRINITPFEATLMLLGIYEDTGSLTFASTSSADRDAAQYLMKRGAEVDVVNEYINRGLTVEQLRILRSLVNDAETHFINGWKVLIATASSSQYVGDIAILAHKMSSIGHCDAIFIIVRMDDRVQVVARSWHKSINVREVVETMGGGGHTTAASAAVKNTSGERVKRKLLMVISKLRPERRGSTETRQERYQKTGNSFILERLEKKLPQQIKYILREIGKVGDDLGCQVFVVGGFVRDLLLGLENFDIDLVVEGDSIAFAQQLAKHFGGRVKSYSRFGTAILTVPDGFKIDLATARCEYYDHPAALPSVGVSSIREDLSRRDFTINAMAVKLNPSEYGLLIDFQRGKDDLEHGLIRIIHALSFVEDPTRIFRAIRFEQRYKFRIEAETEHLLETASQQELFEQVDKKRLGSEIILLLSEADPLMVIKRMVDYHELKFIHPSLEYCPALEKLLEQIRNGISWYQKHFPDSGKKNWLACFLALTDRLAIKELAEIKELFFPQDKGVREIFHLRDRSQSLLNKLSSRGLKPSELYNELNHLPDEILIYLMAKAESELAIEHIKDYLTKLRFVCIGMTGKDLTQLGFKPGPDFSRIMTRLLEEKLDGNVRTLTEEKEYVVANFERRR